MSNFRRLINMMWIQWPPLVLALGTGLTHIILSLLPPLFIRDGLLILTGQPGQIAPTIGVAIAGLLISSIVRAGLFLVANQMGHVAGYRLVRDLRLAVVNHLQKLSPAFYSNNKTGNLVAKVINDVESMELFVAHAFLQLFTSTAMVIGVSIILFAINWQLALVALAPIPPLFAIAFFYGKKMQGNYRSLRRHLGDMAAGLQENLSGMMVIQSFTREKEELERVRINANNLYSSFVRASWLFHASFPLIEFLGSLGTVLVLWAGASALGNVQLQDLVAFFLYLRFFYQPISEIGRINDEVNNAMASAERIFEVLDTKPEIADKPGVVPPANPHFDVTFDHVTFAYGSDAEVLNDVSFTVREGEMLAIVGPSGAGKTTITKLLTRFYDVNHGSVRVGNVDVRDLPLAWLRSNIGLVLQDVFLFDGTVRENLLIGRPNASDAEMIAAAQAANAHEFIEHLPLGYDTRIGERGTRLSGGQKQRLSIARALLKDAPILVLDEATSSVDTQSEALIQQALNRLATTPIGALANNLGANGLSNGKSNDTDHRRTMIVVAHRLSTIKHADRIVVIQHGQIVEEGTHDDLLSRGGLYSELYRAQLRQREWELVS